MELSSHLLLFFAAALFVINSGSCVVLLCSSLSFDDSMSSSPKRQKLQQPIHAQSMGGIWKLTTNSLPYELDDIRSKLDKRFLNDESGSGDDDDNETILLKLNPNGTFKQCDEGYREGRWVTGRWKLQVLPAATSGTNGNDEIETENNNNCWLLQLAMNRQYFGPPYDVLLEATSTIIARSNDTTSTPSTMLRDSDSKRNVDETEPSGQQLYGEGGGFYHKQWQGMVRKGKFIRPSPGKHPFDMESPQLSNSDGRDDEDIGTTNSKRGAVVINTDILMDPEPLGRFSLEQALSAYSIDRISHDNKDDSSQASVSMNDSKGIEKSIGNDDETFFFPPSSSDDGVLQ